MPVDTERTRRLEPSHRGFIGPVRLSRYTEERDVLALTDELAHLEAQGRGATDPELSWLRPALARPEFDLVTAGVDGRLAGFVAGNLGADLTLARLVVASAALDAHPEIPALLLETILAHEDRPWADIVVARGFAGLTVLVEQGWEVVPTRDGDACAGTSSIGTVRLSAAHLDHDA